MFKASIWEVLLWSGNIHKHIHGLKQLFGNEIKWSWWCVYETQSVIFNSNFLHIFVWIGVCLPFYISLIWSWGDFLLAAAASHLNIAEDITFTLLHRSRYLNLYRTRGQSLSVTQQLTFWTMLLWLAKTASWQRFSKTGYIFEAAWFLACFM